MTPLESSARREGMQRDALVRAAYWGPARAAFRVVGPSYLLLVIVAGFIFGGQGLQPSTLVAWMLDTGWGLVCGYATWWMFSGRGYRAAKGDPAVAWLRTFPLARVAWLRASVPWILALELPWLALWGIGAPDWRLCIAVAMSCLGAVGHLQGMTHRPQPRRAPPQIATWELASNLARALRRRQPMSLVVLAAGWTLTTALCIAMGERTNEPLATRVEFTATTLGLATLVSAASLRWLHDEDLRRLRWLLAQSPTGWMQTTLAEILVAAGQTVVTLGVTGLVLVYRLPEPLDQIEARAASLLAMVPNLGVAVLAATLVPVFARGRKRARAPLRAVLLVMPYLFAVTLSAAPWLHATLLCLAAGLTVAYRAHAEARGAKGGSA